MKILELAVGDTSATYAFKCLEGHIVQGTIDLRYAHLLLNPPKNGCPACEAEVVMAEMDEAGE